MIPSLRDIEQLDESALSEQLHSQIADALETEQELALVVRQRDEWKEKAEKIEKLQEENKGILTGTIEKLIDSTRNFDVDIKQAEQNIRLYIDADPQQTARDLQRQTERLRALNSKLQLERAAKEVVCNHLIAKRDRTSRQLRLVSETEINREKNLAEILAKLEKEKRKNRGKRWTAAQSVVAPPQMSDCRK